MGHKIDAPITLDGAFDVAAHRMVGGFFCIFRAKGNTNFVHLGVGWGKLFQVVWVPFGPAPI